MKTVRTVILILMTVILNLTACSNNNTTITNDITKEEVVFNLEFTSRTKEDVSKEYNDLFLQLNNNTNALKIVPTMLEVNTSSLVKFNEDSQDNSDYVIEQSIIQLSCLSDYIGNFLNNFKANYSEYQIKELENIQTISNTVIKECLNTNEVSESTLEQVRTAKSNYNKVFLYK